MKNKTNKPNKTGAPSVKVIEKKSKKRTSKKRKRKSKRPLVPPFIKQTFLFLLKLFALLTVSVVTAWLGVEFTKEFQARQQEKIELKAKQLNEVHELELVFKDNNVSFAFYVEEANEVGETSLNLVELPVEKFSFHQREEFPYPYLRVVCSDKSTTCTLGEAKSLELYFDPSDLHSINVQ